MDQELKNHLDTSLSALEHRLVALIGDLNERFEKKLGDLQAHVEERFDRDLKEFRAHVEERFDRDLKDFRAHVDERFDATVRAMAADVGAQHTQLQQAEARFSLRQKEQDVRIERHAALLQSGARQLQRTFDNQEKLSDLWRELESRGASLEKRLFALERPSGNPPPALI